METNCDSTPKYTGIDMSDQNQDIKYCFNYKGSSYGVVVNHCNNRKSIVDCDGCPVVIDRTQQHLVNLENDLFLAFGNLPTEDKMI